MGAKSKSQVIPSCWKGLGVELTSGHREGRGAGRRAGAEDTQPRTLAERPGSTSMVLIHSTPSKCGLRDGAGAGQVGASFLFFFNAGGLGLILGLGRSPGEENGYPLQYSCLENPHEQRNLVGYSL